MSDSPRTWKGVARLLRKSETVVVSPSCFTCGALIVHEGLREALTVILATNHNSHRTGIAINCPTCGKDIAVFDPLRREEFAHDPTH